MKDLWALRLQKLYEEIEDPSLSGDTTLWFSSQTEISSGAEEDNHPYQRRKAANFPRLIDSLALCYLGILLLRIPFSLGSIYRYLHIHPFQLNFADMSLVNRTLS